MLVTRDPQHLHVFFSGHRVSLTFPAAMDDYEIVAYARDALRDLGASFASMPSVAVVANEDSCESPRQMYTGRACLHRMTLELIGTWQAIPASLCRSMPPPLLNVRSDPRDALLPCP